MWSDQMETMIDRIQQIKAYCERFNADLRDDGSEHDKLLAEDTLATIAHLANPEDAAAPHRESRLEYGVTSVNLPDLYVEKVERLGETWGLHVRRNDETIDRDAFDAFIFREGKRVAVIASDFGKWKTIHAGRAAMKDLMFRCERRRRKAFRRAEAGE